MKAAQVLPEFAVGVLICACIPGSGLGHLIVLITGTANCELSVAINCLHIFLTLGKLVYHIHVVKIKSRSDHTNICSYAKIDVI